MTRQLSRDAVLDLDESVAANSAAPATQRFKLSSPATATAARRINTALCILTVACLGCYLTISLSEYSQFLSNGYDLGIFDQAVRAYAHFQAPISPIKAPGFDVMGDHFSPIIALCAPLYWIWDNPCMLLIAQASVLAWSVPIIYRFARRRCTHRVAMCFATVYGLGWPLFGLANFDFHEVAFAVPFLAAAIDALDRRAYRRFLLWVTALLFVKEDIALVAACLGIVILAQAVGQAVRRHRTSSKSMIALGTAVFAMGLSAYELVTRAVIPTLAPNHSFAYWQYQQIGDSLTSALTSIVTRPVHVAQVFISPFPKSLTIVMLFSPFLFLSLRSRYVLLAIPLLAERFFNSRLELWSPLYHYNALPWVVISLAAIDAFGRSKVIQRSAVTSRIVIVSVVTISMLAGATAAFIESAVVKNGFVLGRLLNWDNREVVARRAAVSLIPNSVCVEADNELLPHLSPRDFATLPGARGIKPDFILLDLEHQYVGPSQGEPGAEGETTITALARVRASGYLVYRLSGPVVVLRASSYEGPSSACGPLASGKKSDGARP